ncbi:MAG TPA: GFA family protein, partial [Myxococcales bacterium]|nr:GFA family protein [Myxococcales bacterium]
SLSVYEWGAKVSKRFFCRSCGVHCFGRGHLEELGGDYVSVNVNCLDGFDPALAQVVYFDGRHNNWEVGPRSTPWPIQPAGA